MLQPFNYITLEFGGSSSVGMAEMTAGEGKTPFNIDPIVREGKTDLYSALKLDGTTAGKEHHAKVAGANDLVVGVLTEVFKQSDMGSQVMQSGIVNMKTSGAVQPGDPIQVSGNGTVSKASTANNRYFGIALSKASADEFVDVLLQLGGLQV